MQLWEWGCRILVFDAEPGLQVGVDTTQGRSVAAEAKGVLAEETHGQASD